MIQYLKSGFPLSLAHPDSLHNQSVNNHHSAIQFPEAVEEYIAKEKAQGTLLGPVKSFLPQIYGNNRRINLSHPRGQSLNDTVDKVKFDNRNFTLRFPSIDDLVNDANLTTDPLIFKIDVARAFRNLRVDPVDALTLGITWNDAIYVDGGIAFGWTQGSENSLRTSNGS